jgi:formylglycine-generating enzyme required for sulfatase activity
LGKRLPTETEWQCAAQGPGNGAFPWGDEFDPRRTHCLPDLQGGEWEDILGWRADLLRLADTSPPQTTVPVGINGSESPSGIRDLAGNVWEWTASSFAGPMFSPLAEDRDALDIIYDQRSYVVIKGGTWSALPEQVSSAFRGRDLAYDRHFEIGFRCVCSCPQSIGDER